MGLQADRERRRARWLADIGTAAVALMLLACEPHAVTGPGEPEGAQLVFNTFDLQTGSWGVATATQDGRGERDVPLIAANPGDYPDIVFHNVQWSPDGRRIAYRASNTNTDNWYLVLSDAYGSFKRTLTPLGGYMENARWSPRGDRLLYDWGGFVGGSGGQSIQTAVVDTLGNRTDFFIEGDGNVFGGERVYFGLLPWADSSGVVPALYDAAWAADGEHLVVVGTIGRRAWDPGLQIADVELFRVSVATRRVIERVTHNNVPEWGFRLAPDERHMLLTVWHESSAWHPIEGEYFMPVLGQATDLIRIFEPPNARDAGSWSTDSRHITYTRPTGFGGYPGIFIHDIQTRTNRATTAAGFWAHLYVPPS
jgi:dipeptidyl aminopeptidase/acylaminoacyl peptidase